MLFEKCSTNVSHGGGLHVNDNLELSGNLTATSCHSGDDGGGLHARRGLRQTAGSMRQARLPSYAAVVLVVVVVVVTAVAEASAVALGSSSSGSDGSGGGIQVAAAVAVVVAVGGGGCAGSTSEHNKHCVIPQLGITRHPAT